jgi:outer membrane protein TolC
MTDVHQAQQRLDGTKAALLGLELQICKEENNISLLLGRNPGSISRGPADLLLPDPHEILPASRLSCWNIGPIFRQQRRR